MLGAGMVIIQENTHKIVVVFETKKKYWFFPRGRKDIGESLEKAALRESYEESGYRAQFLPLMNPTRQPPAPDTPDESIVFNMEPIYMTITASPPRRASTGQLRDAGREYLTTWYVGQIPEDAVREVGTGMPDEQNYESHLLPYEEALQRVWGSEKMTLRYAWAVYCNTLQQLCEVENERSQQEQTTSQLDTTELSLESLEVSERRI
jgi:ADP-ribose pyrophosphatase YjhB (NUDIX family)